MNNKIILYVALAASLLAAVVSFKTSLEKKKLTQDLATTTETLNQTQNKLADTTKRLQETTQAKETLDAKVASLNSEVENVKASLAAAEAKTTELQTALTNSETQIKESEAKLAQIQEMFGDKSPDEIVADAEQAKSEAEDLRNQLRIAEDKLAAVQGQVTKYQAEEELRRKGVSPPGVTGKIVAYNSQWNFVVLDIGKNQGVVENSELTIVRNDQAIGKIRIASVDQTTSVADVVRFEEGARPTLGDLVISN
ncbi:MAG: hypothetical protein K1X66_09725 [Verrucomicrobiae bacterium]|nr:hypothetical protein [Verrucomicrobiae bacterium]